MALRVVGGCHHHHHHCHRRSPLRPPPFAPAATTAGRRVPEAKTTVVVRVLEISLVHELCKVTCRLRPSRERGFGGVSRGITSTRQPPILRHQTGLVSMRVCLAIDQGESSLPSILSPSVICPPYRSLISSSSTGLGCASARSVGRRAPAAGLMHPPCTSARRAVRPSGSSGLEGSAIPP